MKVYYDDTTILQVCCSSCYIIYIVLNLYAIRLLLKTWKECPIDYKVAKFFCIGLPSGCCNMDKIWLNHLLNDVVSHLDMDTWLEKLVIESLGSMA